MPNLARLALLLLVFPVAAQADQLVTLVIQNHTFSPSTFEVPAGERFRIQLTSHDESVDEFESYDMKFEKIIVPGNTVTVFAGPLHPGTYTFFDDYHPDQAKGTVTAVAAKE
ncbi:MULTISPECIES: cupredoxin domain-containing protein [Pseudomonas]|jgi:heme/copper-type cytochrome/quinol oxidase subunit 2|uniref:Cupredoxin domain-containing protein n=1 Tax=Pseudomonas yamanorum TaxID=515393 RepID=A0A1H2GWP0_9PSED|nr:MULTISPECIES: cupredoxin domain-containing protein [Pseudomonas]MBK5409265.1 cupredoxin domain-containing protein [Pseudomonas sp. TH34]MBV6660180.1 cupredoxin domain-containing protein [Pseudomonas yamanorum]MDR0187554.1 cupredoxin domain-containing protein [Pseudomonas yamanorum]NWD40298.1 cupredoxin domain-containing protein [Pseudomonas yamanorum]SDU24036.1 Cupredoxin-like domain-containing protein [Pseudomonas yamanorum]